MKLFYFDNTVCVPSRIISLILICVKYSNVAVHKSNRWNTDNSLIFKWFLHLYTKISPIVINCSVNSLNSVTKFNFFEPDLVESSELIHYLASKFLHLNLNSTFKLNCFLRMIWIWGVCLHGLDYTSFNEIIAINKISSMFSIKIISVKRKLIYR